MAIFATILNRELNAWHHLPDAFQEPRLVVVSPHAMGPASLRALFPFLREALIITDATPGRIATAAADATPEPPLPTACGAEATAGLQLHRGHWIIPTTTPAHGPHRLPGPAVAVRPRRRRTGLSPDGLTALRQGRYQTAIFLLPHAAASGRMMLALLRAGVRHALFEEVDGWHRMPLRRAILTKFRVQSVARRMAGGLVFAGRMVDDRLLAPCINLLAGPPQRSATGRGPRGSTIEPGAIGGGPAPIPAADPLNGFTVFIEGEHPGRQAPDPVSITASSFDPAFDANAVTPLMVPLVDSMASSSAAARTSAAPEVGASVNRCGVGDDAADGPAFRPVARDRRPVPGSAFARPLRVRQYIGCLNSGGAERQLANVAKGLQARGHEVSVLTMSPPEGARGHFLSALSSRGIEVRQAGTGSDDGLLDRVATDPKVRLDLIRDLPAPLRDPVLDLFGELVLDRPDVLHCWLDHPNVVGGIAALAAGVPQVILSTRNVNPTRFPELHRPWMQDWYRTLARSRRVHFIANSVVGAEDYAAWLDLHVDRFHVVRNGVDPGDITVPADHEVQAFRASIGATPGRPLVAGIFRLAPEKRPDIFVQVLDRVRRALPDVVAVIAGIGPLYGVVQSLIDRHGLTDCVHLLGRRHDIPVILKAADLMLLTSEHEGTPNCVLEAMALGRPVVATRAGGTADVLTDGANGLVAPVNDVPRLAHDVVRVLRDPELARSLGEAGARHVVTTYDFDLMVEHTLSVYAHAIQRPAHPGRSNGPAEKDGLPEVQLVVREDHAARAAAGGNGRPAHGAGPAILRGRSEKGNGTANGHPPSPSASASASPGAGAGAAPAVVYVHRSPDSPDH